MVNVRWPLPAHVRWLSVEAMGRRSKVRMLWPTPRRVFTYTRMWHAVPRVMVRRSNFWKGI